MKDSWAAPLGECEGGLSNEHLVSTALWPGATLQVSGFAWCGGEVRDVSAESIASHILCRKHNNGLSDLDAASGRAFEQLRQSTLLVNQRLQDPTGNWVVHDFEITAPELLERWFLKTMLNLLVVKPTDLSWRSSGRPADSPPESLLRLVFGTEAFAKPLGLYSLSAVGDAVQLMEAVTFSPLLYAGPFVVGGVFTYGGWTFVLHLEDAPPPETLTVQILGSSDISTRGLFYHLNGINYNIGPTLSHRVLFPWQSASAV